MKIQMISKPIFILSIIITTSSCSTIHFQNGESSTDAETYSEYHHMAGLELVELSAPVDMRQRCKDKEWQSVKTQRTFLNGLVGAFTQPFYSPWEVTYSCAQDSSG